MHAAMHQLSLLSLDMPVKLIKLSFISSMLTMTVVIECLHTRWTLNYKLSCMKLPFSLANICRATLLVIVLRLDETGMCPASSSPS